MKRESGILLSITSLPSRYGIGCFSKEAYEFVDRLKEAGQSYWQILPWGPPVTGIPPTSPFPPLQAIPISLVWRTLYRKASLQRKNAAGPTSAAGRILWTMQRSTKSGTPC